jgi:hypothetical protein
MAEAPRPRIEAIRIIDMSSSNSWTEFAAVFRNTRQAFLDHERSKTELKARCRRTPEDYIERDPKGGSSVALAPRIGARL